MAKPIDAAESYVGSYTSVYRGRGWSRPTRTIEITLGERRVWLGREGRWAEGDTYEFSFDTIDDAERIAKQILAEVKVCKAAAS